MTTIITIHSFRGGTGKTITVANLAVLMAEKGLRVGIIDTNLQSPGLHIPFGIAGEKLSQNLNQYLGNMRDIKEAARDVTPGSSPGKIFIVPCSANPGEIMRIMREGYDVERLEEGINRLNAALTLDVLLLDTHPGLNEETLLSIASSDTLLMLLRPERQDYEGTGIMLKVAQHLNVKHTLLLVNQAPAQADLESLKMAIQNSIGSQVVAVLPFTPEMGSLSEGGIFALAFPDHPLTKQYGQIADTITR